MSYELLVWVAGAKPEATAAPVRAQQAGGTYGDGTISFEAGQDPAHPLVFHDVQAAGLRRASAVYFDPSRYSAPRPLPGAEYTSGRSRHSTAGRLAPISDTS